MSWEIQGVGNLCKQGRSTSSHLFCWERFSLVKSFSCSNSLTAKTNIICLLEGRVQTSAWFLVLFFIFSSNSSTCHLKKNWGTGRGSPETIGKLKFENKNQHGIISKVGEREIACLSVLERQQRRFLRPCLVCPVSMRIRDSKQFYKSQDQGILDFCMLL